MSKYDVVIAGGGASGLMCATLLAQGARKLRIAVIEKNEILGKKLSATGNGKCNLTNSDCPNYKKTLAIFEDLGVFSKEENGWFYPYSMEARVVVKALVRNLKNVDLFLNSAVTDVSIHDYENPVSGGDSRAFHISYTEKGRSDSEWISSRYLVLAMGGKAAPQFGTTGDGFRIAKSLGHNVRKLYPVLAPVQCEDISPLLKGLRRPAKVKLFYSGKLIFEEYGRVQFTDFGLSGICIFNLTRFLKADMVSGHPDFSKYEISLDLTPDISYDDLKLMLESAPGAIESLAGSALSEHISKKYRDAAAALKSLKFHPTGLKGWREAQTTGGGVPLEELTETMASLKTEGLYILGEMTDYDGPCGGFNLDNAWRTAALASEDLLRKIKLELSEEHDV